MWERKTEVKISSAFAELVNHQIQQERDSSWCVCVCICIKFKGRQSHLQEEYHPCLHSERGETQVGVSSMYAYDYKHISASSLDITVGKPQRERERERIVYHAWPTDRISLWADQSESRSLSSAPNMAYPSAYNWDSRMEEVYVCCLKPWIKQFHFPLSPTTNCR